MRLPNFLLMGAPNAATTSLAQYLGQHPEVFMAVPKEPDFLAFDRAPPAYGGPGTDRTGSTSARLPISDTTGGCLRALATRKLWARHPPPISTSNQQLKVSADMCPIFG
jgi:hypothetical protein